MNKAELIAAAAAEISKKDCCCLRYPGRHYRALKEGDKGPTGWRFFRGQVRAAAPAVTPVPRKLSRIPLPRCPCSRPAARPGLLRVKEGDQITLRFGGWTVTVEEFRSRDRCGRAMPLPCTGRSIILLSPSLSHTLGQGGDLATNDLICPLLLIGWS